MKKLFGLLFCFVISISSHLYSQTPVFVPNTEGISNPVKIGNGLFFIRTVDSASNWVQQVWTTNTSISGATQVKSLGVLYSPIGAVSLTAGVNGKYYFVVFVQPGNEQLWVSDGTSGGTFPLFMTSKIYAFHEFNNELYFSGYSYTDSTENGVYKTDGTPGGTVLLKNMQTRYGGSIGDEGVYNYRNFNNKIIFTAKKGIPNNPTTHYSEIWSTDGTSTGFVRLDSLFGDLRRYAGGAGYNTPSDYFREFNGYLYFCFINKSTNADELWRTNGTVNNAAYYYAIGQTSSFHPLIVYNGNLILAGNEATYGMELYTTDGVSAPALIKNINIYPNLFGSKPSNFNITCGKLFFLATDSAQTYTRIWQTDGTTSGTVNYTTAYGTYDPITKQENGMVYYAFQDNDSVRVYKIDTVTCAQSVILRWGIFDLGGVGNIIQINPLFMVLSGGSQGVQGLYILDPALSVTENDIENEPVLFYPNPANDMIGIRDDYEMITITNILGEIVYTSRSREKQISVAGFSKGVYTVTFFRNNKTESRKLMIQ